MSEIMQIIRLPPGSMSQIIQIIQIIQIRNLSAMPGRSIIMNCSGNRIICLTGEHFLAKLLLISLFLCPSSCSTIRHDTHRVKRLYRRQLSVPLVGNDEVLAEIREAFPDDRALLADAFQGHAKASEMVRAKALAYIHPFTFTLCLVGFVAGMKNKPADYTNSLNTSVRLLRRRGL